MPSRKRLWERLAAIDVRVWLILAVMVTLGGMGGLLADALPGGAGSLLGGEPVATATPRGPAGPAFTYRAGWDLATLDRHVRAGEVLALSVETPDGAPARVLARTADGQVVPVETAQDAAALLATLRALGHEPLFTREALTATATGPAAGAPSPLAQVSGIVLAIGLATIAMLVIVRFARSHPGGLGGLGGGAGERAFGTFRRREREDGEPADEHLVTMDDVAGCEEAKFELQEAIDFLRAPERYRALGATIPRGFLLEGPPGTDKTLLAKATAAAAGCTFHYTSGSEFVEKFVGVGASRVREIFAAARKDAPAIVFIDEIDAVGRARGGVNSHDEREQTLDQLLVEMDGFADMDRPADIIVIAATNRAELLDPALLRPGRFTRRITVDLPDPEGRLAILRVHARNKPLGPSVDLEELARGTYGFSGADLADMLNEAAIFAARSGRDMITPDDIAAGMSKTAMGTGRSRSMPLRERSIIAAHEAGHALCGTVHGDTHEVREVSMRQHGRALGYTWSMPRSEANLPGESELRARLVSLMGGRAAEALMFEEVTGGAADDFEKANDLAIMMVTRWGMGRDPEAPDDGPTGRGGLSLLVDREGLPVPEALRSAQARAIRALLDEAYAGARATIAAHMAQLERVAGYLVVHEHMDGATYRALFDGTHADAPAPGTEWRSADARPVDRSRFPFTAAPAAATPVARPRGQGSPVTPPRPASARAGGRVRRWLRHGRSSGEGATAA